MTAVSQNWNRNSRHSFSDTQIRRQKTPLDEIIQIATSEIRTCSSLIVLHRNRDSSCGLGLYSLGWNTILKFEKKNDKDITLTFILWNIT